MGCPAKVAEAYAGLWMALGTSGDGEEVPWEPLPPLRHPGLHPRATFSGGESGLKWRRDICGALSTCPALCQARQAILGQPTSTPQGAVTRTSPFPREKARLGRVASLTCIPTAGGWGEGLNRAVGHTNGEGRRRRDAGVDRTGARPLSYSGRWGRPEA